MDICDRAELVRNALTEAGFVRVSTMRQGGLLYEETFFDADKNLIKVVIDYKHTKQGGLP